MAATPCAYAVICTVGHGSLGRPVFSASMPMKRELPVEMPCHSPVPAWLARPAAMT
jgi:hypothetical protein